MNQEKPAILIVDDVPHNIQIVGSLLGEEDYDIFFAQTGEEALKIARQNPLTLVLMDVMMPGKNGLETAKELSKLPGHGDTPVIFLTALTEKDQILAGFEAGGVDYITKPFHRSELLARVRTHVSLKTAKEELRKARAAQDRFFAILAHDLKNPFQSLLGLMQAILEDWKTLDPEEVKMMISGVLSSSQKTYELLLNLLDWGRNQTGGLKLSPEIIPINSFFEKLTASLDSTLKIKDIQLEMHSDIPHVWADRETLEILVRNLLSNAVKFSPKGSSIELWARKNQDGAVLAVVDHGVGMEKSQQDSLFDISVKNFTRGTMGETGTGLGLILCKSFAVANGGSLTFESQPGKGTTFFLQLPLNPPGTLP